MKKKEPVNDLGENGPEKREQGGATPGMRGKVDGQTPSPVCGQPSTQCQSTGIGVRNQNSLSQQHSPPQGDRGHQPQDCASTEL